jgi:hypothetical protein
MLQQTVGDAVFNLHSSISDGHSLKMMAEHFSSNPELQTPSEMRITIWKHEELHKYK